ncbi:MAG: hypothetical protein NTW86_26470, partial [Candidatus Sumerlaeota bacterium]|nr:hypothetical protein [Candidatus Sumerlaeota bacterium]
DCVEMKNRIQAERAKEYAGLSEEEIAARRLSALATSDHPAAQFWRRLQKGKAESQEGKVA